MFYQIPPNTKYYSWKQVFKDRLNDKLRFEIGEGFCATLNIKTALADEKNLRYTSVTHTNLIQAVLVQNKQVQ